VDETTVVFSGTEERRRSLPSIEESVLAIQQSYACTLRVDSVRSVDIVSEAHPDSDGGPGPGRWDRNQ
jgi:hypothetical protein